MKWGVRRYQFADGSLTPAGRKRYSNISNLSKAERTSRMMSMRVSEVVNTARTTVTGKQYADSYLSKGITFSRIQTSKDFENFAFYATYKNSDSNKYLGLFGKNLTRRAEGEARRAEELAKKTGDEQDVSKAKELRNKSDNMKIYQLKIESTKKLKVPSDENAGHITANLLKDPEFKKNVEFSIQDSKAIMKRPTQQVLFKQAENALTKSPDKMTSRDKISVYKALNLSLTNHKPQEIAAQNRFYGELKKKGYNALLDYNDREYSSYHAKRPMIVFDTDSVRLKAVSPTNPKVVNKMYKKYNAERVSKEAVANTLGLLSKMGSKTVSDCGNYVDKQIEQYFK